MDRLPSLNGLRAFEAAARRLSFTAAALELNVTHGAVSRQVAGLESSLQASLFVRGAKGLRLTREGESLARGVSSAFDILHGAVSQVRPTAPVAALKVSVPPTLAMRWLIPRMSALYEALPTLKLELSTSTEPIDFSTGRYDAAIRRIERTPRGVQARRFLDARPVPVCSPTYQKTHRIRSASDLVRSTLIVTRSEPNAWPQWLRRHGVTPAAQAKALTFEQLYFAAQAAVDSLGVALVPGALVRTEIEEGRLVQAAPTQGESKIAYALLWPNGVPRAVSAELLARWLCAEGDLAQS